jgi:hypothetical protein
MSKKFTFTTEVRSPIHGTFLKGDGVSDSRVPKEWIEELVKLGYAEPASASDTAAAQETPTTPKK